MCAIEAARPSHCMLPPRHGRMAATTDQVRERVSVADLFEVMRDRAFGVLMLIFAVSNSLPLPPGSSSILAAPLLISGCNS